MVDPLSRCTRDTPWGFDFVSTMLRGVTGVRHQAKPADRIEHGDHGCLVYDSDEQWAHAVSLFVGEGLQRGEQVHYFADAHTPTQVGAMLLERGVEVDTTLASGQLRLLSAGETYLSTPPFHPDRMATDLGATVEAALQAGYRGYRVVGDMAWACRESVSDGLCNKILLS